MDDPKLNPLPMQEALEYWAAKIALDPADFYALEQAMRARAFTVSSTATADMILDVKRSIDKALLEGLTFDDWKSEISDVIEKSGWTGPRARRLDVIFRTNMQSAYQAGRWKQMQRVVKARPYWRYLAVKDSRTRPSHLALDGKVYRADHPFWDTYYPPNGFQCRCTVQTLSERQVEARGYRVESEMPGPEAVKDPATGMEYVVQPIPDQGWEHNPAKEAFEPDLDKYPDWLRQKMEA